MAPTLTIISETVSGSNLAPEYTLKTRFLDFLEFPGFCLEELAEVYQSQFAVVVVVVCIFVYLFVCFFLPQTAHSFLAFGIEYESHGC